MKIYLVCTNEHPGGDGFGIHSVWSTANSAKAMKLKLTNQRQYAEILRFTVDESPESPAAELCATSAGV